MADTHVKICSSSYSPANGKLEHQGDMTEHLLGWLLSKILKIPNVGDDVEQQNFSFMLVRMPNIQTYWKTVWQCFIKTKHIIFI